MAAELMVDIDSVRCRPVMIIKIRKISVGFSVGFLVDIVVSH
jgi:hypothetical protein